MARRGPPARSLVLFAGLLATVGVVGAPSAAAAQVPDRALALGDSAWAVLGPPGTTFDLQPGGTRTYALWLRYTQPQYHARILSKGRRPVGPRGRERPGEGFAVFVHQYTGTLGVYVDRRHGPGDTTSYVTRGTAGLRPIGDGRWHHVAVVQRDTLLLGYVDGKLDIRLALDAGADYRAPDAPLMLGWGGTEIVHFVGGVDELSIWDRALSPAEIRRLMYHRPASRDAWLLAYWSFDHDAGDRLLDLGALRQDGQLVRGGHVSATRPLAPPFRETWTYRALLGLAGLAGLYALLRLYAHRLQRQKRRLERLVEQRTVALERANEETARALETVGAQATRLRGLDEAKSRFFANVSHELRTPLTLILGPLDGLLEGRYGPLSAGARGQHELMRRNARRLLRLVNQILDLAKLEASELTLDARPGDLVAFAREVTRAFSPLADRRGIGLAFAADVPAVAVAFDAAQLEKVLLNLLSNALKFTDADGTVTVSVHARDDVAEVAVRDTGVGIAAEALPHVFDRFWQADSGATRRHEGTGIGLALARELVALHGGTVRVESTPGLGSTFTVALPRLVGVSAVAPGSAVADDGAPFDAVDHATHDDVDPVADGAADDADGEDRTTVLVVDDNPDVRVFLRSVLQSAYRVIEEGDGVAALARASTALPDLIVADVMMPGLDGLELVRALRGDAATEAIPVVLLTARAAADDHVAGLEAGADVYLPKPFEPAVLEAQVAGLLAQRRRLRARFRSGELPPPAPTAADRFESALMTTLRAAFEPHLSDDGFSPEALAAAAGLSYKQLYRRLHEEHALTPSRFLRTVRVERAADLLRGGTGSITEVAYSVGFNSLSYFNRAFRERFGRAPSEYLTAAR